MGDDLKRVCDQCGGKLVVVLDGVSAEFTCCVDCDNAFYTREQSLAHTEKWRAARHPGEDDKRPHCRLLEPEQVVDRKNKRLELVLTSVGDISA